MNISQWKNGDRTFFSLEVDDRLLLMVTKISTKISIIQQLTWLADAHSPLTEGAYGAAIVAEAAVVVVAVQVHRVQVPLVLVEMRDSFVEYEQMVDGPDHVVVLREGEEAEVGSFEVELHPPGAGRAAEAHHEAEHGGGAEHRGGVGDGAEGDGDGDGVGCGDGGRLCQAEPDLRLCSRQQRMC